MKNKPPIFDHPKISEGETVIQEAESIKEQLHFELERIKKRDGYDAWEKLHEQVFMPESLFASIHVDRQTLYDTVVYHILIGSTPPRICSKIDLPGDQNLVAYAKRKLEWLKQM